MSDYNYMDDYMNDIKAIETKYNGYRFRSRLEARWAVFFDALDIEYQYESEGFELEGIRYLPDFWLPKWDCWVEIKPEVPKLSEKKQEYELCQKLSEGSNKIVLMIGGYPHVKQIDFEHDEKIIGGECHHDYRIAIFCPDMLLVSDQKDDSPNGIIRKIPLHSWSACRLSEEFFSLSSGLYGFIAFRYKQYPDYFTEILPVRGDAKSIIEADKVYYKKRYNKEHPFWIYGIAEDDYVFSFEHNRIGLQLQGWSGYRFDQKLLDAHIKACSARFEYGENG